MKFLTIDTTTKVTALALSEDGSLVGESFLHIDKTHSERLVPMLDHLLSAAGWELSVLDFIGVIRGPGSFTGIRIGLATAQGLAQVLKIPLVGVLSLDALAWAACKRPEEVVVILDARKNEWYSASYRWNEAGQGPECFVPARAIQPQELLAELNAGRDPVWLVGDAVAKAEEAIRSFLGSKALIPPDFIRLPRGAYAVREVWRQWRQSGGAAAVTPFYIRRSEAEVNWVKKQEGLRNIP